MNAKTIGQDAPIAVLPGRADDRSLSGSTPAHKISRQIMAENADRISVHLRLLKKADDKDNSLRRINPKRRFNFPALNRQHNDHQVVYFDGRVQLKSASGCCSHRRLSLPSQCPAIGRIRPVPKLTNCCSMRGRPLHVFSTASLLPALTVLESIDASPTSTGPAGQNPISSGNYLQPAKMFEGEEVLGSAPASHRARRRAR